SPARVAVGPARRNGCWRGCRARKARLQGTAQKKTPRWGTGASPGGAGIRARFSLTAPNELLRTAHTVAAVVAKIAVAVADCDGAAVVAAGAVGPDFGDTLPPDLL